MKSAVNFDEKLTVY